MKISFAKCIVLQLVDSFARYGQSDKITVYCVLSLKMHFEEPNESRGSRTVMCGAGGETPLAYSTVKKETMHTILQFNRRGPPADWEEMAKNILECIA